MFQENGKSKTIITIFIIIGFLTTFYVGMNTPKTGGIGIFFLLPLSFTLCCILFKKILPYHRGGFGLKVLYTVIVVRYVAIPFFTCYTGSFSGLLRYPTDAFDYGVIMQIIELLVTCIVIRCYFEKTYNKCCDKYGLGQKKHYYDNLSLGGWLVILFSLFVISRRGLGTMLASMRFMVLSESLEKEAMYGYDIWMAHTLLAFLVIVISAVFQKREETKPSPFNILIPLIITILSCSASFGDNRMTSVYFAVSGIAVLMTAFPRRKATIVATIVPVFLVVIVSFTMIKNFGYDVTSGGDSGVGDDDLVATLSAYVSTTQNIAKAYHMYGLYGDRMSIANVISDFFSGIVIFQLPMFHGITRSILSTPSSIALASTSTEVVPMAGQALFYGGYAFGWLIDIIFFVVLIRLLLLTDCYSKIEKRLGNRYLLTWVSVTFGMLMTYNLLLIWFSINYVPLFTLFALWLNRTIRLNKQSVKERNTNG